MDYKMIRLEQTEGIAVITLDYAPTLNALDMNMSLELEDALKKSGNGSRRKNRCHHRRRPCILRRRRYPLYESPL